MTLNTAKKDMVELRRERVSQLRLRGLTLREIANTLANGDKDGNGRLLNPDSGLPYTHVTIKADLDALKETWHASANVATEEHQARQAAELQEIKRFAWSQRDGKLALSALDKEMKLLGTMKQPDGLTINIQLVMQLVQVIEQRGDSASEVFEDLLREYQNADLEGN